MFYPQKRIRRPDEPFTNDIQPGSAGKLSQAGAPEKPVTQSELAQRMGIKQATVSNFENHPEKTTLTTVFKILQSLELSMAICEKNAPDTDDNRDNPRDLEW